MQTSFLSFFYASLAKCCLLPEVAESVVFWSTVSMSQNTRANQLNVSPKSANPNEVSPLKTSRTVEFALASMAQFCCFLVGQQSLEH